MKAPAADELKEEPLPNSESQPGIRRQSTLEVNIHPTDVELPKVEMPAPIRDYLQNLLTMDPYNKYCVDCHKNESTHASISFGTFICEQCASTHKVYLAGKSYIKSITAEAWDEYQLRSVSKGIGGN